MKKKIEFNFLQKSRNVFEYPDGNKKKLKNMDKWTQAETTIKNHQIKKLFQTEPISSFNIGSLKSMEWNDIKIIPTQKNDYNKIFSDNSISDPPSSRIQDDEEYLNLQQLIHPIDNEFEEFIQKKIESLEKLKTKKNLIKKTNNTRITIDYNAIDNNNENNNRTFNIQNEINNNNKILLQDNIEEKSIVKEKNETFCFFNENTNGNKEEASKRKQKSFLADYALEPDKSSIFKNNKKNNNNSENESKNLTRLKNLLTKIRTNKECEIVNKPNKFQLFDKSDDNNNFNLSKIQKRYYQQYKDENKQKDNYSKDYFSIILNELNK
jgi:hypothetical protein